MMARMEQLPRRNSLWARVTRSFLAIRVLGARAPALVLVLALLHGSAHAADAPNAPTGAPGAQSPPADVTLSVSQLAPGEVGRIHWARFPVIVLRRDEPTLQHLRVHAAEVAAAPRGEQWFSSLAYAHQIHPRLPNWLMLDQISLEHSDLRSTRAEYFVAFGFSPYDGCTIEAKRKADRLIFENPCQGEQYDAAGRVQAGHQLGKSWNLYIPPHRFDGDALTIGVAGRTVPRGELDVPVNLAALLPSERYLQGARLGRLDVVSRALSRGTSVDTSDPQGNTALMLAVLKGRRDVVDALLAAGADPDRANREGIAPIYAAVFGQHPDLLQVLLAAGADVQAACSHPACHGSPLIAAVTWGGDRQAARRIVEVLRAAGADPAVEYQGKNAIDWAVLVFREDLVPLLR